MAIVKSLLLLLFYALLLAEVLSFYSALNFNTIALGWGGLASTSLYSVRFRFISGTMHSFRMFKMSNLGSIVTMAMGGLLILMVVAVLVQGFCYPPNNWDSMTYHMSRVVHWYSQGTIAPYPTHIVRQLYQPPLSEIFTLHISVLAKNDAWANLLQWCCWLACIPLIQKGFTWLGKPIKHSFLWAAMWVLTLPMAALQASSTQNDLVLSFLVLASVVSLIEWVHRPNFLNGFWWGLSISLSLLTKATAYLWLGGFGFMLFIFLLLSKKLTFKLLKWGFVWMLFAFSLNIGHFTRNLSFSNSILGTPEEEKGIYTNVQLTTGLFFSNLIKNSGLHLGSYPLNGFGNKVVEKIHLVTHQPILSEKNHFNAIPYRGRLEYEIFHEDYAPNPIHAWFLVLSFFPAIYLAVFKKNKSTFKTITPLLAIGVLFLIFCAYLKWQPWHSRLHLPLFIAAGWALPLWFSIQPNFEKRLLIPLFSVMVCYAATAILLNASRSLLPVNMMHRFEKGRYAAYFNSRPQVHSDYKRIYDFLLSEKPSTIGLYTGIDDYQYPILQLGLNRKIQFFQVGVQNSSVQLGGSKNTVKPEFIFHARQYPIPNEIKPWLAEDLFPENTLYTLWATDSP